jgi:hypothetical protein
MSESDSLPLLNVFEVSDQAEGGTRHLLAFIETVRAGAVGIDPRSIVGEVTPIESGGYDPWSLKLNPEFIGALTAYMNEVQANSPEIIRQARMLPSAWVYIIDPRNNDESEEDPPPTDLVGAFAVDAIGQIIPQSFQYNASHALIDQDRGMSGLFYDRGFYDWLHQAN